MPSVAIREGVLKNIEITAEHFRALYNNLPFEHFVYDAKRVNRLRQFATSNTLQILVINIDAFRKNFTGTEDEQKSNVIYKESDKLSGRQPIEFVQAARPDRHHRRAAERGLAPRRRRKRSRRSTRSARSATRPRTATRTTWSTGSTRARLRAAARQADRRGQRRRPRRQRTTPSCGSSSIDYKKGIKAKLRIHVQTAKGPKEKSVTVKNGADLFIALERAGHAMRSRLRRSPRSTPSRATSSSASTTARTLRLGEEIGGMRDDVWRAQIKHTVKRHLDKELQLRERGIKVLRLFFIDRVANYRDYDGPGAAVKGKFAEVFEAELAELAKDPRYAQLDVARSSRSSSCTTATSRRTRRAC